MIWEEMELVGLGFAVVLLVLMALWATTAAVGQIFVRTARAEAAAKERAAQAARMAATRPAGADGSDFSAALGIPPHHLAVMGAAVAAMTGGRYRIVNVDIPPHRMPAWINEGRFEHMSSHGGRASAGWTLAGPPHVDHPIHDNNPLPSTERQQKRTP